MIPRYYSDRTHIQNDTYSDKTRIQTDTYSDRIHIQNGYISIQVECLFGNGAYLDCMHIQMGTRPICIQIPVDVPSVSRFGRHRLLLYLRPPVSPLTSFCVSASPVVRKFSGRFREDCTRRPPLTHPACGVSSGWFASPHK